MIRWLRSLWKPAATVGKYEVYQLRLEDVLGAEITHSFWGLAKIFRSDYFKKITTQRREDNLGNFGSSDNSDATESQPPWYDRIIIVAPGFNQRSISKRPYFRPAAGTNFVIFYDNGRIDRLEISRDGDLLCYYYRDDEADEYSYYSYYLSKFSIGDGVSLNNDYSGSFSLGVIVKIIMLEPLK